MKKGKYKIYALCHPLTGRVWYVGATNRALAERAREHVLDNHREKNKKKRSWMSHMVQNGLYPVYILLETVKEQVSWEEREQYWIKFYREQNPKLLNKSDGGLGNRGFRDEVTKENIRQSLLGHEVTAHTRQKLSDRFSGEGSVTAKLTVVEVASIRASTEPNTILANRYKVHPSQITRIKQCKTW